MNSLKDFVNRVKAASSASTELDGFEVDARRTTTDYQPEIQPVGTTLYNHQRLATEVALKYKRAILGFPPGTGKTVSALSIAANHGGRTVIVHPPTLRYDPWILEIEKSFPHLRFFIAQGEKPGVIPDDVDVVLIGDSVLLFWADAIKKWKPEVLVGDEAHRYKNPKAKRSKAVKRVAEGVRKNNGIVTLLTGTLAPNDAEEVWMPVSIVGQATQIAGGPSYDRWIKQFCYIDEFPIEKKYGREWKTIWVKKPSGSVDPVGLHNKLRDTCYIYVRREDILDMPPKHHVSHSVMPSKEGAASYNKVKLDFKKWREEQGLKAIESSKAEKLVQLGALVEQAALAVVDSSAEYVQNMVEQGESVVVMAHHKSVVAGFREALKKLGTDSVRIAGDDSQKQKQANLEVFKSGKVKVLVGNVQAAGTGLNLDVSSNLVFIELPWSPAVFEQASDRIYRITQEKPCTIHTLYMEGSVTEKVASVLEKKMVVTTGINTGTYTGEDNDEDSVVDAVWEDYE